MVLMVAGSVVFVVLGAWMAGLFGAAPESSRYPAAVATFIGWAAILFFGFCALVLARRLFDGGELLRIGPDGIRWRRWSDQTIPWTEITDVTSWGTPGNTVIVLHLRDPDRFPGRGVLGALAGANRKMTQGDVSIALTDTNRSFAEAMAAVERFRPAGRA